MIKFKVCPRCRGDLYLSEDIFGKFFSCLQCGYLQDVVIPRVRSSQKYEVELESAVDLAEEKAA